MPPCRPRKQKTSTSIRAALLHHAPAQQGHDMQRNRTTTCRKLLTSAENQPLQRQIALGIVRIHQASSEAAKQFHPPGSLGSERSKLLSTESWDIFKGANKQPFDVWPKDGQHKSATKSCSCPPNEISKNMAKKSICVILRFCGCPGSFARPRIDEHLSPACLAHIIGTALAPICWLLTMPGLSRVCRDPPRSR